MNAAEVLAVRYLMLPLGFLWGAVIGGALELGGLVMLALGLAAALILRMLPVDSPEAAGGPSAPEFHETASGSARTCC